MGTFKVKVRPTGLINGQHWPEVGGEIELPDSVAEGMVATGSLEAVEPEVEVETRPAPKAKVEKRPARGGK